MLRLFASKKAVSQPQTHRLDGYSKKKAAIVCEFQAIVESESGCDYTALSATLLKARHLSYEVSIDHLRQTYTDFVWASFGVSNRGS